MEPMSESITEGAPAPAEAEIVQQPANETTVPDSGTEQTSPAPDNQGEPEPKKTPWFQRRIDELTREKHEAKRQADQLAAQLQQARQTAAPKPAQPTQPTPAGMVPLSEVQAIVARERADADFTKACNDIADTGEAKYGAEFKEAVNTFGMLGGPPPAFLEALTEFSKDEAARLFHDLGKDPDEAARITKLSPAKMAVALAKMAATPAKTAPVSKAPPPITPLSSTSTRSGAEPDSKDIKAWTAWFQKQRSR